MRPLFAIARWSLAAAAGYSFVWMLSDPDPAWAKAPRGQAREALAQLRGTFDSGEELEDIAGLMPASGRLAPPFDGMQLSTIAIELVREAETLRLEPARHAGGGWVIGYGHTLAERPMRAITRPDAEALLREDLARAEDSVRRSVTVPLNDNEYGALVEFAHSIGPDGFAYTLVAGFLNADNREAAADAFLLWSTVQVDGALVDSPELIARRRRTKALFLSGSDRASS